MIDDRNRARVEQKLLDCFLVTGEFAPWNFRWDDESNLIAESSFIVRKDTRANFTVTFKPFDVMTQFKLEFPAVADKQLSIKYNLRDIIDDYLWSSLPIDQSLFEFSIL